MALSALADRGLACWPVEPLFMDRTVFCIASGPSATPEVADKLRGHPAIVVNSTCRLAPWADVLFFTDTGWFEGNFEDGTPRQAVVRDWGGIVVTMSRLAKGQMPSKIRLVRGEWAPDFPAAGSPVIRRGRSSGHSAVALAVQMGASRVVLVGYDMRLVDGKEHHHRDYAGRPRDLGIYEKQFVPAFDGWHEDALRAGVEIVNATPGSAVQEFPFVNLDEILACDPS